MYKLHSTEDDLLEALLPLEPRSSPVLPLDSAAMSGKTTKTRRPWRSYVWFVHRLCCSPHTVLTYFFHRDTWDKSPEERKFLGRLDACLLTYAALSYFSKYLDQQNVTVRIVSLGRCCF